MEALCRWTHPTFGVISPDVFVPIAEECGLIQKLGLYVLEEACGLLAELSDSDIGMSVNASALELMSSGYALHVLTMLSKFNLEPSRLEIEITESVAADSEGRLLRRSGHCELRALASRLMILERAIRRSGSSSIWMWIGLRSTRCSLTRSVKEEGCRWWRPSCKWHAIKGSKPRRKVLKRRTSVRRSSRWDAIIFRASSFQNR